MKAVVSVALMMSVAIPPLSVSAQEQDPIAWSKIRALEPGTEVIVRTPGSAPRTRYFVAADNDVVTLLDVSDLPPDVVKLLRRAASEHPAAFVVVPGNALMLNKQVVLRSSGLFVADQKVADYDQIVDEVTRADVENGVVLLGKVGKRMETCTKTLLAVGIPVTALWIFTLIMRHVSR